MNELADTVVYEIARYTGDHENSHLIERIALRRHDDHLVRLASGEPDKPIPTPSQPESVIAGDSQLHMVHVLELTTITAEPELAALLPLVLQAEGVGDETLGRDEWEVTINGASHSPYATAAGAYRLLPDDGFSAVAFDTPWVSVSFIETGSMTSGTDVATLGLVTPSVVAAVTELDPHVGADDVPVQLWRRGDAKDDARVVVDWLTNNGLVDYLTTPSEMLIQLFVDAAINPSGPETVRWGNYLAARFADEGEVGSGPSARWSLDLNLSPETLTLTLDLLAAGDPEVAHIVEAARDPESPAGQKRRALLEDLGLSAD
ncbi:hypothetical protein [Gordonia terrae]